MQQYRGHGYFTTEFVINHGTGPGAKTNINLRGQLVLSPMVSPTRDVTIKLSLVRSAAVQQRTNVRFSVPRFPLRECVTQQQYEYSK